MPSSAISRQVAIDASRTCSAASILDAVLADPSLYGDIVVPREVGRYTRALVLSDWALSVWLMRWAPGSRTPIHDHHCACSYAIVSGALTEVTFRPCGGDRAAPAGRRLRTAGGRVHLQPSTPNIHQMINETDEDALSIHVYGFDPLDRANSIERVYTVAG